MPNFKRSSATVRFILYLVVVVLVNMAAMTLSARFDLTAGKAYSISPVSQKVVATLSEPLTIQVFFTRNLPAPYNGVERYLRDLLAEYAVYANRHFNYRFHEVSAEEGDITAEARENQKLANNYGIHPIQIQAIEKDEVKFQRAYMGMVLIHGDLIEQLPTITTTDGLEYRITTAIQKMNDKISALLRLTEPIRVKLYMSPSMDVVAPYMGLKQLPELPSAVEQTVKTLNARSYGKLAYEFIRLEEGADFETVSRTNNLLALSWPASADGRIAAGKGAIGLVVAHGERQLTLPLIDVVRLPILGTQYKLVDPEGLEKMIAGSVDSLIDIYDALGVLADHSTAPVTGARTAGVGQDDPQAFSNFRALITQSYTLTPVTLSESGIPEGIGCLLIVKPREKFSDYDLFQIDQFLMQGKSLALFLDAFDPVQMPGQPPNFRPIDTGLEKLLEYYGVRLTRSIVMDENCYRQQLPAQMGGGERPIYYAPVIKNENIAKDLDFMHNIKGLVAVKAAALELVADRIQSAGLKAHRLLASSAQSWEMKDRIVLDPMFLRPPADKEQLSSRPLAYLIEGEFPSYFAGKPIPQKEAPAKPEGDAAKPAAAEPPAIDLSKVERSGQFIAKGKPARLFLMGSSDMLTDMVVDETGRGVNSMFVLNVIDALNQRDQVAVMRSKEQRINPLAETSAGVKTFVKSFNTAGLPLLVCLFGLIVWLRRAARKRAIQAMFRQPAAGREASA
jgi:ABC-type uncharacterized transport system involved in gliding motility auxiliary subunit